MSHSWRLLALATAILAGIAAAADENATEAPVNQKLLNLKYDVNQHWMIYAGSIVFLMQAGFSLLEAGSVAAKNSTNILYKNLLVRAFPTPCICPRFCRMRTLTVKKFGREKNAPRNVFALREVRLIINK